MRYTLTIMGCVFLLLGFLSSDVQAGRPVPPPNASPIAVSVTPPSGNIVINTVVNFKSVYSDADGWQNLSKAQLLINTSTSEAKCFDAYYDQNTNKFYLRDDANKKWLGGYAPGSVHTVVNSYAVLDCSKSTISGSGSTLSITWAITFKTTFTGTKNLYLYVTDDKGAYQGWVNKGTCTITATLPDTTPPTGTIVINNNSQYTNSVSVSLILSAQDNAGGSGMGTGAQMQFSNDNKTWSVAEAYATTKAWTLASGDGTKTVYVKYKDVAGNWSTPVSSTIILDTTAPATTISGVDGLWHNGSVTVTLAASDAGSGVNKTCYSTDGTNPTLVYTAPFTLTNAGTYTIKYYSLDKAGNSEAIKTASNQVKIDTTAPSGSIQINNAAQYADSISVILSLSATDSDSGLNQMQFSNDNTAWSAPESYAVTKTWNLSLGDGTKTVYVKFKDVAGNWSAAYSATIILDTTPPQINIISPLDNEVIKAKQ